MYLTQNAIENGEPSVESELSRLYRHADRGNTETETFV